MSVDTLLQTSKERDQWRTEALELKARLERLLPALQPMLEYRGCNECGIVFVDGDAYGNHACPGRRSR